MAGAERAISKPESVSSIYRDWLSAEERPRQPLLGLSLRCLGVCPAESMGPAHGPRDDTVCHNNPSPAFLPARGLPQAREHSQGSAALVVQEPRATGIASLRPTLFEGTNCSASRNACPVIPASING